MELLEEPFRLVSGDGTPRYYPAHIAIKDRHEPGLRFELMAGRPWRWTGAGVPAEVRLVDVLAAAALARPPPIQVVGNHQTSWLWARTQATDWVGTRPGVAWRSGLSDAEIEASGRRLPGRPRRQAPG